MPFKAMFLTIEMAAIHKSEFKCGLHKSKNNMAKYKK